MKLAWAIQCGSHAQKLVLLALCEHANAEGVCWPSVSRMALICDLSRQGVIDQLRALEKKGLIRAIREQGKSNRYCITPVKEVDQSTALTSQPLGLPPVNGVDHHQSTALTGPVNGVDPNHKEPSVEPSVEPSPWGGVKNGNRLSWFPPGLTTPEFKDAFRRWEDHSHDSGKPLTPGSRTAILTQLQKVGEPRAIEVIEGSLAGNWKSLVFDFDAKRNGSSERGAANPKPKSDELQKKYGW